MLRRPPQVPLLWITSRGIVFDISSRPFYFVVCSIYFVFYSIDLLAVFFLLFFSHRDFRGFLQTHLLFCFLFYICIVFFSFSREAPDICWLT
ncbi:uncharacterized protein BYT42DRAFT_579462 [Radiomyces spectabilis]|uniref:uncharacterized protein n=1 Tax=Radiomyces spectabilis TaxID=64574 RepID=UPI00222057DB|nr:uncharacterized protein BYT42DRAFT_579462 [Radiomyces spectabilis]KAI8373174.1 hypothetical protein BYT42DRAFT_579462 [Radiomyces spectabilis]